MRRQKPESEHTSRCDTCGAPVGWRGPVYHCDGSPVAFHKSKYENPHHGHQSYGYCWKCHRPLGCDRCQGADTDVLCTRCAAWETPAALEQHGPILNTAPMLAKRQGLRGPEVREYPSDFQAAYRNEPAPEAPGTVRELFGTVGKEIR